MYVRFKKQHHSISDERWCKILTSFIARPRLVIGYILGEHALLLICPGTSIRNAPARKKKKKLQPLW